MYDKRHFQIEIAVTVEFMSFKMTSCMYCRQKVQSSAHAAQNWSRHFFLFWDFSFRVYMDWTLWPLQLSRGMDDCIILIVKKLVHSNSFHQYRAVYMMSPDNNKKNIQFPRKQDKSLNIPRQRRKNVAFSNPNFPPPQHNPIHQYSPYRFVKLKLLLFNKVYIF